MCEEIQKWINGCQDVHYLYYLIIKEELTTMQC